MIRLWTNVSINKKVWEKAREHEINVSNFLEIKLREYIALIEGKELIVTPINVNKRSRINNSQDTPVNSKSNNTFFDNDINSRARGVAWHPSTLGYRVSKGDIEDFIPTVELNGVTDNHIYNIRLILRHYLKTVNYKIDKDSTFSYLKYLKNWYSIAHYRK